MPLLNYFDYCIIVVSFEITNCSLPVLFFSKIVLDIWDPLRIHMNFRTFLYFCKKRSLGS